MLGRFGMCALAILVVSVGGCLDGGGDVAPEATPGAAASGGHSIEANLTAFRFSDRGAGSATVWANATVPAYHECARPCYENVTDVTHVIPGDVPARVVATVTWEESELSGHFLEIRRGQEAVLYESAARVGDFSYTVEALLLRRGASVEVLVTRGFPEPMESSYSLEIVIEWRSAAVPSSVPVAFEAHPENPITFTADGEGNVEAVVYGAGDEIIERFSGSGPVEFVAPETGRFVLLPLPDGGNVTLRSNASGPERLIPMRFERTVAPFEPFVAATIAPHSWTFSVDEPPVRVGAAFIFPSAIETAATQGHTLIESAAGVVVDERGACADVCSVGVLSTRPVASDLGHPDLVAGDYTVTYTPGAAEAGLAYHFVERIVPV